MGRPLVQSREYSRPRRDLFLQRHKKQPHFHSSPIKPLKCQLSHVIVKYVKMSSQDEPITDSGKIKLARPVTEPEHTSTVKGAGWGRVIDTGRASSPDSPVLQAKCNK